MKIAAHALSQLTLPNERRGCLVCLEDEAGHEGLGEATPLPGYSPDTVEGATAALEMVTSDLASAPDSVNAVGAWLDTLEPLERSPAARFALESALFSLLARRTQTSVAGLFGAPASRRVPVNGVVTSADCSTWLDEARALASRGLHTVKIKIGKGDFAREHAALVALRAAVPVALRLDANGRLGDRAAEKLDALVDVQPDFVEEPVSGEALLSLGRRAVPWVADESLAVDALRERLLVAVGITAVVLKPAVLGGYLRCRALASEAAARGLGVVVTHLFDGDVAHGAACELALSLDGVLACGLDRHAGMTSGSPYLREPGFIVPA